MLVAGLIVLVIGVLAIDWRDEPRVPISAEFFRWADEDMAILLVTNQATAKLHGFTILRISNGRLLMTNFSLAGHANRQLEAWCPRAEAIKGEWWWTPHRGAPIVSETNASVYYYCVPPKTQNAIKEVAALFGYRYRTTNHAVLWVPVPPR